MGTNPHFQPGVKFPFLDGGLRELRDNFHTAGATGSIPVPPTKFPSYFSKLEIWSQHGEKSWGQIGDKPGDKRVWTSP